MSPEDSSRAERDEMVRGQIEARGIRNPDVLAALREVPRDVFVPQNLKASAYNDIALPIIEGQTISQPYVVALMIEAAGVEPGSRVLEVGTGSGYAAAVLSRIAAEVYTVERHEALVGYAMQRLRALDYRNIYLRLGDGTLGWPERAPFSAILVAAGGPSVPRSLREQLIIGGRLVMPVGDHAGDQGLLRIVRVDADRYEEENLGAVRFVPLIGAEGWTGREPSPNPQQANENPPTGESGVTG